MVVRKRTAWAAILLVCGFAQGLVGIGISGISFAQTQERLVQRRFDRLDVDGDGSIAANELSRPELIDRFDQNRDGSLSTAEYQTLATEFLKRRNRETRPPKEWKPSKFDAPPDGEGPLNKASILSAARYSARYRGVSFLVMHDGRLIYQEYPNGSDQDSTWELASGTKSFSGVLAAAAVDDGLLHWDEVVSDTIESWKDDRRKSRITVSELLGLTSGISPASRSDRRVPSYASAIKNPMRSDPGQKFDYGPAAFQCFGELMRLKLIAAGLDDSPLVYLQKKIFEPIDLHHGHWRHDVDGNPHLPSGASLTAQQWAKFGELVRQGGLSNGQRVVSIKNLQHCFQGSPSNPAYGKTFWLNQYVSPTKRRSIRQLRADNIDFTSEAKIPDDLVFAAGAGHQRLYICPSLKLTVVRQADGVVESLDGNRSGFSDLEFLKRLIVSR